MDRAIYPTPDDIMGVLSTVHAQALKEIPTFDGPELDDATEAPHAAYDTRYGALIFASNHEMLHAGQIGLLRRMIGKSPLR